MRKRDEDLGRPFKAIKGKNKLNYGAKLEPTVAQKELAKRAVLNVKDKLPSRVKNKINERYRKEGHYINTVRYYPYPILAYDGSANKIKELINWGHTYSNIIRKITSAYHNSKKNICRLFLYHSIIKFLPSHLIRLINNYKTIDDLAGAHLGDDNVRSRTIEWNLGAVGGLDEGFLVSNKVAEKWVPNSENEKDLRPVERDPVESVRDALHWAYESFCLANNIRPVAKPLIAYIEHDDIYGSTVSISERLSDLGENIYFCFHHELSYKNSRLRTLSGRPVDLVYMDCHLEDLQEGHPVLEASTNNVVAMDCSPFAHLILRSKVIIALLCDPEFVKFLGLDNNEIKMLERHIVPTCIWRRKTFREGYFFSSAATHALLKDPRFKSMPLPFNKSKPSKEKLDKIVVKIALGSVYGGSAVSVIKRKEKRYNSRDAAKLALELIRTLAINYTTIDFSKKYESIKLHFKGKLKELILLSLSRRLSNTYTKGYNKVDPFWSEVVPNKFSSDEFLKTLKKTLQIYFNIDLNDSKSKNNYLLEKFENEIRKSIYESKNFAREEKIVHQLLLKLGQIIANFQYRQMCFGKKSGDLINDIKNSINYNKKTGYSELTSNVMDIVENFFIRNFGIIIPETERNQLLSILLEPYMVKQFKSVNPIIIQPYLHPESLSGESGFFIMNRIHILFTKNGRRSFISGTQVFSQKDSKPDNHSKMTGSLWIRNKE